VEVRNTMVPTWAYPGWGASYVTPAGVPQTTAAGYRLASAMTSLPEQEVARVLKSAWATWLNWHTTDAQLAAALGIRMPAVPAPPAPPRTPGPGMTTVQPGPGGGPQSPVCTA
jgi:ABC-type Co2+ transport system permease subunit